MVKNVNKTIYPYFTENYDKLEFMNILRNILKNN